MAPKKASSARKGKGKGKAVVSQSKRRKTALTLDNQEQQNITFESAAEREGYKKFRARKFIKNKYMHWGVLQSLRMDVEVQELVSVGAWRQLFRIIEPTYRDLTAEFIATFKFVIEGKDWMNAVIQFQMLGMRHSITVAEFSVLVGLYDREFTERDEFRNLVLDMGADSSITQEFWHRISLSTQPYDAGCSKASTPSTPALRYIHAVLSHSITGRGSSTGVVSKADLIFFWSMVNKIPIHLGYWLAHTIHHQSTDSRVGNVVIEPYVTRLLKGIGMFELLDEVVYREMEPVGYDMLVAMKMVTSRTTVNGLQYSLVNAAVVEDNVIPEQQPNNETEQVLKSRMSRPALSRRCPVPVKVLTTLPRHVWPMMLMVHEMKILDSVE